MKKVADNSAKTSRRSPVRRGAVRGASATSLAPELLPVQVLRDLLVEAWLGAIADGAQPVLAPRPRSSRARRGDSRSRAQAGPAPHRAPIRERILAEIERQRGAAQVATRKGGRRAPWTSEASGGAASSPARAPERPVRRARGRSSQDR